MKTNTTKYTSPPVETFLRKGSSKRSTSLVDCLFIVRISVFIGSVLKMDPDRLRYKSQGEQLFTITY